MYDHQVPRQFTASRSGFGTLPSSLEHRNLPPGILNPWSLTFPYHYKAESYSLQCTIDFPVGETRIYVEKTGNCLFIRRPQREWATGQRQRAREHEEARSEGTGTRESTQMRAQKKVNIVSRPTETRGTNVKLHTYANRLDWLPAAGTDFSGNTQGRNTTSTVLVLGCQMWLMARTL